MPRGGVTLSRRSRISSGGHGYSFRNQDRASSFALRPSFHWRLPIFGGAYLNQSSTDRISFPDLLMRIRTRLYSTREPIPWSSEAGFMGASVGLMGKLTHLQWSIGLK